MPYSLPIMPVICPEPEAPVLHMLTTVFPPSRVQLKKHARAAVKTRACSCENTGV